MVFDSPGCLVMGRRGSPVSPAGERSACSRPLPQGELLLGAGQGLPSLARALLNRRASVSDGVEPALVHGSPKSGSPSGSTGGGVGVGVVGLPLSQLQLSFGLPPASPAPRTPRALLPSPRPVVYSPVPAGERGLSQQWRSGGGVCTMEPLGRCVVTVRLR